MTTTDPIPLSPPEFPAGRYVSERPIASARRCEWISEIERLPVRLRQLVDGMNESQVDTRYKNWTVRQIIHHLADSHLNTFVRFRLALTEERPTIKPYDETRWAELADSKSANIESSLRLLESLHARWVLLLRSLTEADFERTYFHPEHQREFRLDEVLAIYAHHGRHHSGQIVWLRDSFAGAVPDHNARQRSVSIRRAELADLPAITEIYNEAILATTATFDTEPKTVEQRLDWFHSHDERHPVIVAIVEGQVVGWASISRWSERKAYDDTAETSFYVKTEFRGRGIGRQLKESILAEARRLRFHTLLARVAEGSEASLHLNESCGFVRVGTMRQVGRKFGRLLDVHILQKILD